MTRPSLLTPTSAAGLHLPGPFRNLRIGLFGGSFNPAHDGHRHVAETALKALQLDYVWWLVAGGNPLKNDHGVFAARLASAFRMANHPRMHVTALETQLGVRYTADLLSALNPRTAGAKFVWIMGADNLEGFHKWGKWDSIASTLPLAVISRPGASPKAGLSKFAKRYRKYRLQSHLAKALPDQDPPAWVYIHAPWHPASSTSLRRRARSRNPFRKPLY